MQTKLWLLRNSGARLSALRPLDTQSSPGLLEKPADCDAPDIQSRSSHWSASISPRRVAAPALAHARFFCFSKGGMCERLARAADREKPPEERLRDFPTMPKHTVTFLSQGRGKARCPPNHPPSRGTPRLFGHRFAGGSGLFVKLPALYTSLRRWNFESPPRLRRYGRAHFPPSSRLPAEPLAHFRRSRRGE